MAETSTLFGISQRDPPSNNMAEQGLLGAILANNATLELCAGLSPEHFFYPVHSRIFETCRDLIRAGNVVDAVTLKGKLEHTEILTPVGGMEYLAALLGAMVSPRLGAAYAKTIIDTWLRRRAISSAEAFANEMFGLDPQTEPTALIADMVDGLMKAAEVAQPASMGTWEDAVDKAMDESTSATTEKAGNCLWTGIPTLDAIWGGLWPQSLDILGARIKQGKTAIAMQIVRNVARGFITEGKGHHVQVFSLEMPRKDLALRMLAMETGVSADRIRQGKYNSDEAESLILARRDLRTLPILVADKTGMLLSDLTMTARVGVRRKGVRLIVVDHLMRVKLGPSGDRMPERAQVDLIALTLKELAKELDVPILLLTQLSRAVDRRDGQGSQRPQISDMMFGGESHADLIALLWRPEMYMGSSPPDPGLRLKPETKAQIIQEWHDKKAKVKGQAEVIIAARRFGETGSVMLNFDGPRTLFSSIPDDSTTDLWARSADEVPPWIDEGGY